MVNAMRRAGPTLRASLARTMDELAEYASLHNDTLIVKVMSRWISLRSKRGKRVFAELRPSKDRVEAFVLPPPRDLAPSRIVSRAPTSQGWGWFRSKVIMDGDGDSQSVLRLLRISYIFSLRRRGPKGR